MDFVPSCLWLAVWVSMHPAGYQNPPRETQMTDKETGMTKAQMLEWHWIRMYLDMLNATRKRIAK